MQQQQSTPEEMSPEGQPLTSDQFNQILRAGEDAARLLGSPVFNIAYQSVLRDNHEDWLNSHPKETAKRESLYHETVAMDRMVNKLRQAVGDAEQLLQKQQEDNQGQSQENRGFGLTQ